MNWNVYVQCVHIVQSRLSAMLPHIFSFISLSSSLAMGALRSTGSSISWKSTATWVANLSLWQGKCEEG